MGDLFSCPVCGFPDLDEPPYNEYGEALFEICPSCHIQFGYSDAGFSHELLREVWIFENFPWRGVPEHKPKGWNGQKQLQESSLDRFYDIDENRLNTLVPSVQKIWEDVISSLNIENVCLSDFDMYVRYCAKVILCRAPYSEPNFESVFSHCLSGFIEPFEWTDERRAIVDGASLKLRNLMADSG